MSEQQYDPRPEFKKRIQELFEEPKTRSKEKKKPENRSAIQLRLPNPPPITIQQKETARRLGEKELKVLHEAFTEFYNKIEGLVVFKSFLQPYIEDLIVCLEDLEMIIRDQVQLEELSDQGREAYKRLQKVQRQLWFDLYHEYQKEK